MGKHNPKSTAITNSKTHSKSKQSTKKQIPALKSSKKIQKFKVSAKKQALTATNVNKKVAANVQAKTKVAKVPKQKKQSKPSGPKGYTPAEYEKFKDYKTKYSDQSNQALKDLLKKNLQSMSGNKEELVLKCADGATLGRIPRCPKCFGGRPKYDYQKGTYYCSGYRDDVDFKNCHSSFTKEQLKRDPWEE